MPAARMSFKPLTFLLLLAAALAAPITSSARDTAASGNCTFHAQIIEACNPIQSGIVTLANVSHFLTPSGRQVVQGSSTSEIAPSPWFLHVKDDEHSIDNVLSIVQQPDGVVKYGWQYGARGGYPDYSWTEDKDGFKGEFGCRKSWAWDQGNLTCPSQKNVRVSGARSEGKSKC